MFIRNLTLFFIFITAISCDFFSYNTSASKGNLQVLDIVIDFTQVDIYPIFPDCEDYSEDDNQKECFELTLTSFLETALLENDFKVDKKVNDTVQIDILIDNLGKASVVGIELSSKIKEQLPKLEGIIRETVAEFPVLKPAIKRGILVNSQFHLAIIVETVSL